MSQELAQICWLGPHAISTRTAHTTTTSSIDRVPKTDRGTDTQHPPLRDCHRTGHLPVYQSTRYAVGNYASDIAPQNNTVDEGLRWQETAGSASDSGSLY